ncbi:MAG TPA: HAMP domain-containing sensor histidine kinase [Solirubrobacteraceae bacterium]|jgi:two-component system sensor histidine kinase VanS|nr:HAMP domain-containing sensor histidine kinase [Solirubrobacteraceae bacterium]
MLQLPSPTVRLRLTLLYSGLFLVSGVALLAATYLIFRSNSGVDLIVPTGTANGLGGHHASRNPEVIRQVQRMYAASVARDTHGLHEGLIQSAIALTIMTAISVVLGWLVAGRVLRPLRTMTAMTRRISERNLSERLALAGPQDELKDLADTVDGLLARLEAHVAEQQRFAANASHELRTPLSITKTLLDVARNDPDHAHDELVDRLREVNTRAIGLTEALLLLSRAGQRSFTTEHVDLSLVAEEAIETLLPVAEHRGVSIETSGETATTVGSHALLLQLTTNLVQNAIVHNLPDQGSVWVTTSVQPDGVVLSVENTGETLTPQVVAALDEPFQRGTERVRADHAGVGLGLAIVSSITEAHGGTLTLTPRTGGGLAVTVQLPAARHR